MTRPSPPPTNVPKGYFRLTRWAVDPPDATHPHGRETFPAWRVHFAALGIRYEIVRAGDLVALFREGEEATSERTNRRDRMVERRKFPRPK